MEGLRFAVGTFEEDAVGCGEGLVLGGGEVGL